MATQEEMNERILAAARSGDVDTLQDCINRGTEVNCQNYNGDTPLHTAACRGSTEIADLLLKAGASLSVVNKKGETPLHTAAWRGRTEVADLLLKAGASLSVGDNEGDTPLHTAAYRGSKEVVDLLLKAGAFPSVVDNEGVTPVHFAVRLGHTEVVELLLERGASPSVVDNRDLTPLQWAAVKGRTEVAYLLLKAGASPSVVNNNGETPLHAAANIGSTERVDLLLKEGASISVVSNQGWTPLHFAARNGSTELVDLMLKAGASLSVVNNEGVTPVHIAARSGHTEVVELLLKRGASPSVVDNRGLTPLHGAAAIGRIDIVDLLLKTGASLFVVDNEGETPLHTATMYGHTEIVDLLLNAGASLSVVNNKGETPLHRAARNGNTEVVDILLKRGASLSVVDNQGETPLHRAARNGKTEVIDILLKRGASPSLVNNQGMTPLYWAAGMGHTEVVDRLLNAGASLSVVDKKGWTPLHRAARWGRTEVLDHLLKAGASLSVVNMKGETPLHRTAVYGYTGAVDLLLKAGASFSAVDNQGETPLHRAAMYDHTEAANLLLKAGASPSVVNNVGKTPCDVSRGGTKDMLQKYMDKVYTMDMSRNTDEIVAQFPMMDTSDEMKELLSKGTFSSYENCIYLGGACNVGKSTLASILIGEEISQHWKSTDGLTIYFGRNGINLKTKEMVPLKQGSDGDVLSKVLRGKPDMTQEKPDTTLSKNREEVLPHDSNNGYIIPETVPQPTDITLSTSTAPAPSLVPCTGKDVVNITDTFRQQSPHNYIIDTIQEDIKEEIRKGTYQIEIAPSDLVDFGGQRSFDMTHQLFMRHKGTFVLMFNGNIDFSDPLKEYEQGETTESILKHWVNSILSYCADDEDILPMIMFSATHSDDFNQEDRKDREKKLIHYLGELFKNHKRQHRIIYDDIFFINGQDKNDPGINKLKSKLVEVAFRQKSWGKRMPMAWVPLDLQMSELRLHNMNIISKEELITLNQRNEDLALTVEQIKHYLNAQHSLGKIAYFDQHGLDNFIIVQPQSLVDILRSFITAKNFWPEDRELKGILCALTDTGKIAKQDLLKLWSQKKFHQQMPNDDLKEFIIQVLVHLDILVEPKHYRKQQESKVQPYLVPCIVKRRLPVTDFYDKSADKMICLSYTLLKSSIPAALSFKLIGAAMNMWPLKKTTEGICLYHQAAILCIDGSNDLHLLVEDDKVFVYLINKVDKHSIPPNVAFRVQECLTFAMTKVLEFYHKSFGKSLSTSEVSKTFDREIGEWCTSGGGCYISVSEVKEKTEWICKNKKRHNKTYPRYWIFNKKQVKCDENCSGLDANNLALHPNDKQLFRLAERIEVDACTSLLNNLGLSLTTWKDIQHMYRYEIKVAKFVALCEWKDLKYKENSNPSFQQLSDALPADSDTHVLCQVFKEDETGNPTIAQQEIPEDDVLQELSRKLGNCAIHLGVELGLDMATIKETLKRCGNSTFEETFDVMKKWKLSSEDKTIHKLMKALKSADGTGFQFLENKYGVMGM